MSIRNKDKHPIFLFKLAILVFFGLISLISHTNANENRIALESLDWLAQADHPIILELFTSADCPGCSIADLMLYDVGVKDKVIALGCHVDYLEKYAHTQDLGIEMCTNRQWFYSTTRWTGKAELKTPEFIANGDISFSGLDHYNTLNKIRTTFLYTRKPQWAQINKKDENTLEILLPDTDDKNRDPGSSGVWLVRYSDNEIIKIPKSEVNKETRIMRYSNVVQDFYHIARWYGMQRLITVNLDDLPRPHSTKRGGWVVLVQRRNGDPIVAAGKISDSRN